MKEEIVELKKRIRQGNRRYHALEERCDDLTTLVMHLSDAVEKEQEEDKSEPANDMDWLIDLDFGNVRPIYAENANVRRGEEEKKKSAAEELIILDMVDEDEPNVVGSQNVEDDHQPTAFDALMDLVIPVAEVTAINLPVADSSLADEHVNVGENDTSTSDMPPPPTPIVTVQPPTPHTSQDAPTSLLEVPNVPQQPGKISSQPKSRSRSNSEVGSEPRRSPRLRSKSPSPTPPVVPAKRSADSSGEEPISKRKRGE